LNGGDADTEDALKVARAPRSGEDSPWPYAAAAAAESSGTENADKSSFAGATLSLSRLGRRGDAHADSASSFGFSSFVTWKSGRSLPAKRPATPSSSRRSDVTTAACPRQSHCPAVPENAHPRRRPEVLAPRFWNASRAQTRSLESWNTTTFAFGAPSAFGTQTVIRLWPSPR
jgi:hypothetical protein